LSLNQQVDEIHLLDVAQLHKGFAQIAFMLDPEENLFCTTVAQRKSSDIIAPPTSAY
jgi:hypothetical protein